MLEFIHACPQTVVQTNWLALFSWLQRYSGLLTALGFIDFKDSIEKLWLRPGRHWRGSGLRRTAHLRAEFLIIALGALVQPLRVMQQLLDLPHLPLAAPQLALQLLHLPPKLRQLRLGRGGRRRRRLGGHAAVSAGPAGAEGLLTPTRVPADPGATGRRGLREAASRPAWRGGPRTCRPQVGERSYELQDEAEPARPRAVSSDTLLVTAPEKPRNPRTTGTREPSGSALVPG